MLFGSSPFGTTPLGDVDPVDSSVLGVFQLLLENPEADRVHVAILMPRDPVSGAIVERRYADAPWDGLRTDPAAPSNVRAALRVDSGLFDGFGGLSGSAVPLVGGIELVGDQDPLTAASDLDELAGFTWDGQEAEVRMGGPDFRWEDFETVWAGRSLRLVHGLERFTVRVQDPAARLRISIQQNLYAGTGGLEGGDDIRGTPKPICVGGHADYTPNVESVLVDRENWVYQTNDGPLEAINRVRDKGGELTSAGDVADVYGWTPVAGQYVTDLAKGVFRLGAAPEGTVTSDPQGDNSGAKGFVNTHADIAEFLLKSRGGYTDDDLDVASFVQLNAAIPGPAFFYLRQQDPTVLDAVRSLLGPMLVGSTINRLGDYTVKRAEISNPVREIVESDVVAISFPETEFPFYQRRIAYGRNYTPQQTDDLLDLSPNLTDAFRDFLSEEYRRPDPAEDLTVQTSRPLSQTADLPSSLCFEADAIAAQAHQLALTKEDRKTVDLEVRGHEYHVQPGKTVLFTYPRFGFENGVPALVLSLGEDSRTRRTKMRIWG